MDTKVDQYVRREKIKQVLRQRGRVTSRELARMFDVSRNTIVKDINALTHVFPVGVEFGRKGAYTYVGDGTASFSKEQSEYLYDYFKNFEAGDDMLGSIKQVLENSKIKE